MPLLDSFMVDHTIMKAPAARVAKKMQTKNGDKITIYDLRFYRPNIKMMSDKGIHTLEHLYAGFMREHLNGDDIEIIDISPMGCKTGFYMSLIGEASEDSIIDAWTLSMQDILNVKKQNDIPELNKYQCGTYKMHSLEDAKQIANDVLNAKIGINKNEDIKLAKEILDAL